MGKKGASLFPLVRGLPSQQHRPVCARAARMQNVPRERSFMSLLGGAMCFTWI